MKTYEEMIQEIKSYQPTTELEEKDKDLFLQYLSAFGKTTFSRESYAAHFTSSAIVLNETKDKVLFAYHCIYQSYGWLGGHADGMFDLGKVAEKELQEESGLKKFKKLGDSFISLECLYVPHHVKHHQAVSDHLHLNVTYVFEASEKDEIRIKEDENSKIDWILLQDITKVVTEPHMISVYQKIIGKVK